MNVNLDQNRTRWVLDFTLVALMPFSASDGEKVVAGRMRCGLNSEFQRFPISAFQKSEVSKIFGCSPRPTLNCRLAPVAGGTLLINDPAGRPDVVVTSRPDSGVAALPDRNGELLALRPGPPGEKGKVED